MIDAQILDARSRYNIEINDEVNELRKEESNGYLNFNLSFAEEDDDYDKNYNVGEYDYHEDFYNEESKVDLVKSDSYEILSRIQQNKTPKKSNNDDYQSFIMSKRDSDHMNRYQSKHSPPDSQEDFEDENDDNYFNDHVKKHMQKGGLVGYDNIINGIR